MLHIQLVSALSCRGVGSAEGPCPERSADEDPAGPDAMALSHYHPEESAPVSVRVCVVDQGDDPGATARTVSVAVKLSQCGTPAEAVGAYLSASTVSGDGARSEAGAAVVGAGVSGHSRAGAAGWGGDLLRG